MTALACLPEGVVQGVARGNEDAQAAQIDETQGEVQQGQGLCIGPG